MLHKLRCRAGAIRRVVWLKGALSVVWLSALGVSSAFAQTMVSGAITANTSWSLAGSPYVLTGAVAVQNGAVLSIDAGVTVYMAAGAGLTIEAGSVQAIGTTGAQIRVLSDQVRQGQPPAPGDWEHWVLTAGAVNSRLEHMRIEHGKGLVINGAAPVLNFLDIRNQQGPAIALDLVASPTGLGNRASGNAINGVVVPSGEVKGVVNWGVRGIPYVVGSGVLAVGAPPLITTVSPNTLEQGERATLNVSGSRLSGLSQVQFERDVSEVTVQPGGGATNAAVTIKVADEAPLGSVGATALADAGAIAVPGAITIGAMQAPTINDIYPKAVQQGTETQVTISGASLGATAVSSEAAGLSILAPLPSRSSVSFRLGVGAQVGLGLHPLRVSNRVGSAMIDIEVIPAIGPQLPYQVLPSLLVLAPDSVYRQVILRAAQTVAQDRIFTLSTETPSIAKVKTASVVLPAGQVEVVIGVAGVAAGTTYLNIAGADLVAPIEVPVKVASGGSGSLGMSRMVGVTKGSGLLHTSSYSYTRPIGVTKGPGIYNNSTSWSMSAPIGVERGWLWNSGTGMWVSRPIGIVKQ